MQVIRHSEGVLRTALISKDRKLAKLFEESTLGEKRLLSEGVRPDSVLFRPVTVHSASDWIPSHAEPTQDFQQFYEDPSRSTPSSKRSIIYVQPIGSLLSYLKKKKPTDAFCIVGITMIDLYPRESWNFVFGQASLTEGVGIFSFARYDSNFYSKSYEGKMKKGKRLVKGDYSVFDGYYTPPVTSMLLLRSCKTLTHEIGHIFGLHHCQWLQCVMQGSNHLDESDRRPPELCPICLRKLQSAVGFNIAERYKALLQWIDEGNEEENPEISASAGNSPLKMVEAFKEHRSWIVSCLAVLQA